MKKNMIAFLLSIVMTAGSIGGTPVLAAETTAEEAVAVEEETIEEETEIPEEADTAESAEGIEEDPSQDATESAEEAEITEETEVIEEAKEEESADIADTSSEAEEVEEPAVDAEEVETENEVKDAALEDAEDIVDSGECGENATWTLTGTEPNLTLIISGSEDMYDFNESSVPWASKRAKIKTVIIEAGITSVGDYAFYSFNKMTTVSLPETITGIGSYSFCECNNLVNFNIPDSVQYIGDSSFYHCSSLKSIHIPDGIEIINVATFCGCVELTSINIPESVNTIWYDAFSGCNNIKEIHIDSLDSWLNIYNCSGISGDLYINDTLLTYADIPEGTNKIGLYAFYKCSHLEKVNIPDSVISIEEEAFYGCSSLSNVTIPDSVSSIGDRAFYGCSSLTSIMIPDSVTTIENGTFKGCSSMTNVILSDSVMYIRGSVFADCSSLKSITLSNSLRSIGVFAFENCSSLNEIHIGSIETWLNLEIGTWNYDLSGNLYINDNLLVDLIIPSGTTRIRDHAFYNCSRLTNVVIPDSVTSIGDRAFYGCNSLTGVTISNCVTSIGEEAFYECNSLASVTIPDSVTSIGDRALGNWDTSITVHFHGTKEQWDAAVGDNKVYYKSIVYNYFSVDADFNLSGTSFPYTGEEIKPDVTVTYGDKELAEGTDYELVYKDNINAGTASVDIKGIGTYSGTATETFTITPKHVSPAVSGIVAKTYNGKAQTQDIVVKDGDTTLVEGTDYTVSYKNNVNAGTASLTILGIGNYSAFEPRTFTIKKAPNTITAKSFTRTYSTKAQTFSLGVKIKNGTPTYKSNTKSVTVSKAGKVTVKAKFIGKATITITAPEKTNYSKQTKKITITVNPTKTALSSVTSPSAGKMTVKWKKNAVGTGYQIQYSTSSKFTSPKAVSVTKNSTLTKTIGGLAKGKKYYVRIRTYKTVGSTKFYSAWSAAKTVTIKK